MDILERYQKHQKKVNRLGIIGAIGCVIIIICIILCFSEIINGVVFLLMAVGFIMDVSFLAFIFSSSTTQIEKEYREYKMKEQEREKKLLYADYVEYTDDKKITLLKRDKCLSEAFRIVDDRTTAYGYVPEKIHVGAVSVGGVTSGGAYKTGGYSYVSGTQKTGQANLMFKGDMVTAIYLTDELYQEALESKISKYLDTNKNCISVVSFDWISGLNAATGGRLMRDPMMFEQNFFRGMPSYEQCEEIVKWMTGEE